MNMKKICLTIVFVLTFAVTAFAEEMILATPEELNTMAVLQEAGLPGTLPDGFEFKQEGPESYFIVSPEDGNFIASLRWVVAPPQATAGGLKSRVTQLASATKEEGDLKIVSETYGDAKVETLYKKPKADSGELSYTISSYVLYNGRVYACHFGSEGDQSKLESTRKAILTKLFLIPSGVALP